jgi:N-acetylneuraminic acid mutarotase
VSTKIVKKAFMLKPSITYLMAMKKAAAVAAVVIVAILCTVAVLPAFAQGGGYWSAKAPMLHPLGETFQTNNGVGVGLMEGKIYTVADNYNVESALTAYFNVYDPDTDTWIEKTPIPNYVEGYVVTTCQNQIYVISGTTQVYDPTNDTWTVKTSCPSGLYNSQASVSDGKIYVIGGGESNGNYGFDICQSNEAYDPASDSWTEMASLPTPVSNYASTVIDNKIYIIGGITSEQTVFNGPFAVSHIAITSTNLVQIYDPATNQWTYGTPLPEAMYGMGAASSTGSIYVFGGIAGANTSSTNPVPVDWTQIYDSKSNSWFDGSPLPTALYATSCANVNGELYVLSGIDNNQNWVTTNYEYTPPGYEAVNSPSPSTEATTSTTVSPAIQPAETSTLSQASSPTPTALQTLTPSASVPEFPVWIMPSIFLVTAFAAVAVARKKRQTGRCP